MRNVGVRGLLVGVVVAVLVVGLTAAGYGIVKRIPVAGDTVTPTRPLSCAKALETVD